MEFQDYAKFANENPTCYLATVEGDQPRVRPLRMWFADKTGFYFETKSVKAIIRQLNNNQKVEVCFYGSDKVMRVTGNVDIIDDMAVRTRCLKERPFLKETGIKGPEDPLLVVFRIGKGEAYFWTRADNMKEAEIPRVKF
jgi:pyridoxamine 5'-phosphate oxidase